MKLYSCFFKRVIDVLLSLIGLIVLFPVLLVVIVLLKINQGGVFFLQKRPGKNDEIFEIIKLKTMTDERDSKGVLLPDEKRITRIGQFVRSNSLDEIPQLINVLKGDMSLIGPRPLLVKYLERYTPEQKRRHNVKPGVTGWAQVNGRNEISWERKFELDTWYVDNVNFLIDLKILILTIKKVLDRKGISSKTNATMETFMGKNNKQF
ncbi:sugar transferase [Tenacibaculum maritimum]|uniref:sugar transferase n=2 Tax=Tenacibaculum maritimum TaxID=107401 RepID=UPI0012E4F85B|nr:sugar transferase [Tenacibaculum maritimum]MCD9621216.1 sugar transferase [Tenacibaculum maritimum]MCD9628134.1 sugar transferase [Tenacibaculum maritimum]MCD9629886.1 sugar transferase [Tenacibaculum maritimum]MCD9632969.1 sugar transferase [Tenacibaculum maritimum]CAA0149797.1 Putative undecaprenyl-phosphate sugar transferase [Tenacibaculum maritimum]